MKEISGQHVDSLFISNNYKEVVSVDATSSMHITEINEAVIPNILSKVSDSVSLYFTDFNDFFSLQHIGSMMFESMYYLLPLFFFLRLFSRYSSTTSGGLNAFTSPLIQRKVSVPLSSWAGSPEVVEECKEIIDYLQKKDEYLKIGATMPKGILMEGPPGTGKTMLAKAIASSTNSSFFVASGSEFVSLFVGMGAMRVRELFANARKASPSIIFIDEIDAVGRKRSGSITPGVNDEREQTLNQLLFEMDGFNNNDNIIVMAATNRKDVLDEALLRPGRFDRYVRIPLPDKNSREQILSTYFNKYAVDSQVDVANVAELTAGFSGAQLKNLVNEAAILSVRSNYTSIQEPFLMEAFEKTVVGLVRKSGYNQTEDTQFRVALHEMGHTLLTLEFSEYFDFKKVSCIPTYNGAGGYTLFAENANMREGGLYTKDFLEKRLIVAMGGKAAETVIYGHEFVSVGASQDLKEANQLARRMVTLYGMSEKLEVASLIEEESSVASSLSENMKVLVDEESYALVTRAFEYAKQFLRLHKAELISKADELQNKQTMTLIDFH